MREGHSESNYPLLNRVTLRAVGAVLAATGLLAAAGCGSGPAQPDHQARITASASAEPTTPPIDVADAAPAGEITLDAEGPYIGLDTAKAQLDFKVTGNTEEQDKAYGLLDANKLKQAGFDFEFAKATEGIGLADGYFADTRKRAADAKLLFGAYHYLDAGNGAGQADAYVKRLNETGGTAGIIMMLDVEYENEKTALGPSYQDVLDFNTRLHELVPGRTLLLYTYDDYWGNQANPGQLHNPASPPGTVLNWAFWINEKRQGPADKLLKVISLPGTPEDPYKTHKLGDWDEVAVRQYTMKGTFGHFDGKGPAGATAGQKTLDFDTSTLSHDELLRLGGR
jgi:hypothetical protein